MIYSTHWPSPKNIKNQTSIHIARQSHSNL